MHLYIPEMDATVVEVTPDGRVRYADGEWATPNLQERRAIIYAARNLMDDLAEVLDVLDAQNTGGTGRS
jgi:acyl-CoA reductase-like NAD-dependent aldehyde dehydrogenase